MAKAELGVAAAAAAETGESKDDETQCESDEYSIFPSPVVGMIVIIVAMAGFFSPFTAFVYFPALRLIASDYGVSLEAMNLTVTAYLIVQGIVPTLLGELSESVGRRPVYITIFSIYCAASIGLVFQRSYAALLILRMLQSAGSSGAIALAYSVIGDIAAPHIRGKYVGLAHIGFNTAGGLGPVIGGLLATRVGWPWIFVFLAALSGSLLVALILVFPETSRSVVGNGSQQPTGLNRTLMHVLAHGRSPTRGRQRQLRVPSILPSVKLIFHKNTFWVLMSNAVVYMMYSILQATLASLVQQQYGLSPFKAGLCYLSFGVTSALASYVVGLITDRDYQVTAKSHGLSIDRRRGDEMAKFPIEEARIRTVFVYVMLCSTSVIGYGWAVSSRVNLAIPLILNCIIGFTVTGIFNALNTLNVDVNPTCTVTASASVSITRCLVAAGGVAVIEVLMNGVGPGWAFTVVGCLCWLTVPVLLVVRRHGWNWRKERAARELR